MAKTGARKKSAHDLRLKKRRYRHAYYLKQGQPEQLRIQASHERRDLSDVVQDALDEYFANHPHN